MLIVDAPIVTSLSNQQLNHGDRLTVSCSVSGNPLATVVWIKNGQSLNLVDKGVRIEVIQLSNEKVESVLEIVNLVRVDSGEYECRAKNSLGTASAKFLLQGSDHSSLTWTDLNTALRHPYGSHVFKVITMGRASRTDSSRYTLYLGHKISNPY
ncbi:unnamed protein product [Echinostoma caproni]|uniref:Ig-like domain-containing protein n=1 Tax=Echinostoma caproni TaxID=27848 RepID=A0A183AAH9_9TREM|nr:unnamed protein product [Echinostoma caproni]